MFSSFTFRSKKTKTCKKIIVNLKGCGKYHWQPSTACGQIFWKKLSLNFWFDCEWNLFKVRVSQYWFYKILVESTQSVWRTNLLHNSPDYYCFSSSTDPGFLSFIAMYYFKFFGGWFLESNEFTQVHMIADFVILENIAENGNLF